MAKQISSLSVELGANVAGFNSGLKSAIPPLRDLGAKVDGASDKLKKLETTSTSTSGSGLSNLKSSAASAGASIAEMTETTLSAVAAIGAIAASATIAAIKLAAPFEAATVQLNAMTGSATVAAGLMDDLRAMAIKSPFEFPELLQTSKRLLAVGINAAAIPKILEQSGNVAVGLGEPISQIGDTLARVAAEGRITSRELRELGPVVQVLAQQYHTSAEGVREMADSGRIGFNQLETALDTMTTSGGQFAGIMEAQADTIGGKWHTLTATLEDDAATLSEKLLKAFQVGPFIDTELKAITSLNDGLNSILDNILELEGLPDIKLPDPDPITVKSTLDPSTQQLQITPVVLPPAIRAGSAEALAAHYVNPRIQSQVSTPKPAQALPTPPSQARTDKSGFPAENPAPPPSEAAIRDAIAHPKPPKSPEEITRGWLEATLHGKVAQARYELANSYSGLSTTELPRKALPHVLVGKKHTDIGWKGIRGELTDSMLGKDGLYHVKSEAARGLGGSLTPVMYQNLLDAAINQTESVATAIGGNVVGHGLTSPDGNSYGGGVSSVDNWKRNRKYEPSSIDKRNLSAMWRTGTDTSAIDKWNKKHGGGLVGGLIPTPSPVGLAAAKAASLLAGHRTTAAQQRAEDYAATPRWGKDGLLHSDQPDSSGPGKIDTGYGYQDAKGNWHGAGYSHGGGGSPPQPGGSGPLNASTPAGGNSSSAADSKDQSIQLQNANQWLYRIELNTRASGTGATIVDF